MKGTRLWQDTGSPLIRGRSRRDRALLLDMLIGCLWGTAAGGALAMVLSGTPGVRIFAQLGLPVIVAGVVSAFAVALIPAFVGAAAGAYFGKKMGYLRPWVSSAAVSVIFALMVSAILAATNPSALR